jgi:uncharacterized protein DUF6152
MVRGFRMRIRFVAVAIAAAAVAWGVSLAAHHSIGGVYRDDERVTIEGELVTMVYRSPHSYLHVLAPDRQKHQRVWAIETASGPHLRQTLAAASLVPGDRVIVTGDPARDNETWRIRLRTIVRPRDGWRWTEVPR